jgi:4-hydroxy-3-polyprenylbenzoate decarboxylase
MPRETPLSTIHLEGMLKLRQAGATILFLAPGFYHGWERVEQLVDFVVGRALDQLGVENTLVPEWGAAQPPVRDSGPGEGVWGDQEVPPAGP